MVLWYNGVMVQLYSGTMAFWYNGILVQCILVQWYTGVVVVYQCSISNVMFIGDIEALLLGSRCVRLLETHALLRGTYPIITSPWPGLAGSHTLWHSTYKCLSTTYL